jgi:RimJ/RimL family protein N-acetyltransferase
VIVGEQVRLREVVVSDLTSTWKWASRAEFFRFLPQDRPDLDEQRAWLQSVVADARTVPRVSYQLGVEELDSGLLVGMGRLGIESARNLRASLGYGVDPNYWGRGYATEVACLLLRFGFENLGLHRIWATHHPDNSASRRVLDKVGFREEGRRRDDRLLDGMWFDSVVCSILKHEWAPRQPG